MLPVMRHLAAILSTAVFLLAACAHTPPLVTSAPTPTATAQTAESPAASLRHDSRRLADKSPFGAVPAGSTVKFGLSSAIGVNSVTLVLEKRQMEGDQEFLEYREVARLPMSRETQAGEERWSASYRFDQASVYGYWFEAATGGKTYVVQNNDYGMPWTKEKGTNGPGAVTEKPASAKDIRRFRHTVYFPDFRVPDWAADVVYYYIFPERFRNGDRRNDPKPGARKYHDRDVEFHSDWNSRPYKPGSGDGSDQLYNNDFYGGDIAGIIEKLDYIRDLGANALYITPMFVGASNHKYDTADYTNIDPAFGSNTDFVRLTQEASRRGIRVIPDTSLNHSGSDSIYFDRYNNYGGKGAFAGATIHPDSPYAGWYSFDATQTDPNKQYKGWLGVVDLPELNKASPEYRRFAYGAPDSVMKLWLDRGAAGWRMDVVPWVPDEFWREWRAAIKAHRPDALTIAETWFDSSKYLLGDTFDSTMNYIFRNTVLDYAAGGKAGELYQSIEMMREIYPPQAFYALMNLLSTHDQARSLYLFGYADEHTDAAAVALAKRRLKLALFFQMIFPGAPAIYYGDEVGVTGGDDPYNRATYPWADLGGKPDLALLADFRKLTRLRQEHAVLRRGSIDAPLFIDDHVIVLVRRFGDVWAITATNNADSGRTVTVKLPAAVEASGFADALTGTRVNVEQGSLSFDVPALYGSALISIGR
ncbi:MAG: glycoside hydrolase family 13 protein [Proteobacteria bacterium]|nr:glycoside hydrolase family 13 protein [Pseudomonadota bacterium]